MILNDIYLCYHWLRKISLSRSQRELWMELWLNTSCLEKELLACLNFFFWYAQFGDLYIFSIILSELGAGIDSGMALTPFPSSIGWDLNPRPSNRESSSLTNRPDFRPNCWFFTYVLSNQIWWPPLHCNHLLNNNHLLGNILF